MTVPYQDIMLLLWIKNKKLIFFVAFCTVLLLSNCNWVLRKLYGVQVIKKWDTKKYNSFLNKIQQLNIKYSDIVADSSTTIQFFYMFEDSTTRNNIAQPIKMFLFINDTLKFLTFNCEYPLKNKKLDWNFHQQYSSFPPKMLKRTYEISITYQQLSKILGLPNKQNNIQMLIFWSFIAEKHSYDFIVFLHEYLKSFHLLQKTDIILINHDDFYIKKFQSL